jgi:hypothetical protein
VVYVTAGGAGPHQITAAGALLTTWASTDTFAVGGGCRDRELTGTYHTLRILAEGTGSGTVRSVTGIVDCAITIGISSFSTCSVARAAQVTFGLTAIAGPNSTFAGWTGACESSTTNGCLLTNLEDHTVGAIFRTTQGVVHTAIVGGGRVESPDGFQCNDAPTSGARICAAERAPGSTMTLTASPDAGRVFDGWTGACQGFQTTCTLTADAGQLSDVGLTFSASAPTRRLEVLLIGAADGEVHDQLYTGSGSAGLRCDLIANGPTGYRQTPIRCVADYPPGAPITLTASALSADARFDGWSGNNTCRTSKSAACSFALNGNTTIIASFGSVSSGVATTPGSNFGGGAAGSGTGGGAVAGTETSGGSAASTDGSFAASCVTVPQPGQATSWVALPAPHQRLWYLVRSGALDGLDVPTSVLFANRNDERVWFNVAYRAQSVPNRTSYRVSRAAGTMDDRGLIGFGQVARPAARLCLRVDGVRVGAADTGPFR